MTKRILFKTILNAIDANCLFKQLLAVTITASVLTGLPACSDPEDLPQLTSTPGDINNTPPSASFSSNCNNLVCNFDASTSTDSDGSIVNYQWNFDDGTNGSAITASHTYTAENQYTVLLIVSDDAGATSSSSQTLSVSSGNTPPSAAFTSDCPTLSCSFDASASSDSDGAIASYSWDLGDGTTGSGQTLNHDYSATGNYSVSLTVTDGAEATGSSSQTVSPGSGNNPPSAFFTSNCPGLSCSFDASASSDSDIGDAIASYSWDFGDGATADTVKPSHAYSADGSYTVVLMVTDTMGASSSSSQPLFVTSGNNPPSAVFTVSCTDLDCNFDANSSSDPDPDDIPNLSYDWNFDDGFVGNGITANHSYFTDGSYSITLTVTDDAGASSMSAQSVTVSTPLDGQALYLDKCSGCHGDDAQGGGLAPAIIGRTVVDIRAAINTVQQMNAPSLSALTDDELQAIADYLITLN